MEVELRFQLGESLVHETLANPQFRATLDRICMDAKDLRSDLLISQRIKAELRRLCVEERNRLREHRATSLGRRTRSGIDQPVRRRLNADQKTALRAADIALFFIRYGRKWQKAWPNDRCYDREFEQVVKRMKPETLDRLLRDDEN